MIPCLGVLEMSHGNKLEPKQRDYDERNLEQND